MIESYQNIQKLTKKTRLSSSYNWKNWSSESAVFSYWITALCRCCFHCIYNTTERSTLLTIYNQCHKKIIFQAICCKRSRNSVTVWKYNEIYIRVNILTKVLRGCIAVFFFGYFIDLGRQGTV